MRCLVGRPSSVARAVPKVSRLSWHTNMPIHPAMLPAHRSNVSTSPDGRCDLMSINPSSSSALSSPRHSSSSRSSARLISSPLPCNCRPCSVSHSNIWPSAKAASRPRQARLPFSRLPPASVRMPPAARLLHPTFRASPPRRMSSRHTRTNCTRRTRSRSRPSPPLHCGACSADSNGSAKSGEDRSRYRLLCCRRVTGEKVPDRCRKSTMSRSRSLTFRRCSKAWRTSSQLTRRLAGSSSSSDKLGRGPHRVLQSRRMCPKHRVKQARALASARTSRRASCSCEPTSERGVSPLSG